MLLEKFKQRLNELSLSDFDNRIDNVRLLRVEKLDSFLVSIGIYRVKPVDSNRNRFEIQFFLNTDLFNWRQFYGFSTYKKLLKYICENERKESVLFSFNKPVAKFESESYTTPENEDKEYELNETLIISFILFNEGKQIKDIVDKYKQRLIELHNKTIELLSEENLEKTLVSYFTFPTQIKIPCKQYLEYFAQFLQDLGVNAAATQKEEAGKVLFSVTPIDDIEALDKIREALAVYLHLPESPIVYNDNFAAMRLKKEIDSLHYAQSMMENELRSAQYTLRLAQQTVESQDKIIQQKDSIIEQQNRVIEKVTSKSIMMDSVEKKEEFEKIFDGLEVGESKELKEKLGIKFNPATSLKTLGKKLLGRDDEIISLDLNKED